MEGEMTKDECKWFETCSAPLCPLDADSLVRCTWFPDEEVCKLADHRMTTLAVRQRKISKATGKDANRGCFTAKMILHPCTIKSGVRGLDPESPITTTREMGWIRARAGNRELSGEEKEKRRQSVLKMRGADTGRTVEADRQTQAVSRIGAGEVK
jgi:hypothetical protein